MKAFHIRIVISLIMCRIVEYILQKWKSGGSLITFFIFLRRRLFSNFSNPRFKYFYLLIKKSEFSSSFWFGLANKPWRSFGVQPHKFHNVFAVAYQLTLCLSEMFLDDVSRRAFMMFNQLIVFQVKQRVVIVWGGQRCDKIKMTKFERSITPHRLETILFFLFGKQLTSFHLFLFLFIDKNTRAGFFLFDFGNSNDLCLSSLLSELTTKICFFLHFTFLLLPGN